MQPRAVRLVVQRTDHARAGGRGAYAVGASGSATQTLSEMRDAPARGRGLTRPSSGRDVPTISTPMPKRSSDCVTTPPPGTTGPG